MKMKFYDRKAYEKYTGESHLFEVFESNIQNSAPYVILLDGAFFATAESGEENGEEIEATITWYGWIRTSPIYA